MKAAHFLIFLGWTLLVIAGTGFLLFINVYGDCAGDARCEGSSNVGLILVLGFALYWVVALMLFKRWSR